MRRRLATGIARLFGTILIAGFLGATLVRVAPGFGYDPTTFDPRLSEESRAALRAQQDGNKNIITFYGHYLSALAQGDWGTSVSLNQPVSDLVRDRLPVSLKTMAAAIGIAWLLAIVVAGFVELTGWGSVRLVSFVGNAALLSAPAAVLALLCLLFQWPPLFAISAIVFAYLFSYTTVIFRDHFARPHVLSARARGSSSVRLFIVHVFSSAAPELLALLGLSVATAFAAVIPIEVLTDTPGIGQLAWQAALGRDLPLIVTLTLLVTSLTVTATVFADLVRGTLEERRP
jgi:ABC-type dipeptide/oligopeptide/nickel transport system permease component